MKKINFEERLKDADHLERINVASTRGCPTYILENMIKWDTMASVVEAAAVSSKIDKSFIDIAISRFPEINNTRFWSERDRRQRITLMSDDIAKQEEEATKMVVGDRDQIILNHILKKDSNLSHAISHLGDEQPTVDSGYIHKEVEWADTSKFRIGLVVAPAWGKLFPPYNLAKLTGLLRHLDYSVRVYDLNIESFHHLHDTTGIDYWASNRYFYWNSSESFSEFILPDLKDVFDRTLFNILQSNPKVVGFSLYDTNIHASLYLIRELRYMMPDVCIVVGGPGAISNGHLLTTLINYKFIGEAEENFVKFLEELTDDTDAGSSQTIGTVNSKLDLDVYPYPDYSDYNFSNYEHSYGVSIETSRGCVADCSFCAETHFWKFRSMTPERVVDEIEYQQNNLGVSRFWFVDSLVNGNLKNFQKLVDLILERNIKIHWNSYARCDGRMTAEFLQKVTDSGCTCLSYGVESGSQKVLNDMRKKIDIWEVENNLKDSKASGMFVHINWMVGFPTEEPIDCLHSFQLLFNCRNWIDNISPGFGASPPQSIAHWDTNWKDYGMNWIEKPYDNNLFNSWHTDNNTAMHRFLRIKLNHVWLDIINYYSDSTMINAQRYHNIQDFYTFTGTKNVTDYIIYDQYVNLNRNTDNTFFASITNEYFALLYVIYTYFGAFKFTFKCNAETDFNTFGDYISRMYDSDLTFEIDSTGNYNIKLTHKFVHDTVTPHLKETYRLEREKTNYSFDGVFEETGNIKDWISSEIQTKETIHEQYRNKSKKVFKISND